MRPTMGPWEYDDFDGEITTGDGTRLFSTSDGLPGSTYEADANSRLAAAAPEFAEILRQWVTDPGTHPLRVRDRETLEGRAAGLLQEATGVPLAELLSTRFCTDWPRRDGRDDGRSGSEEPEWQALADECAQEFLAARENVRQAEVARFRESVCLVLGIAHCPPLLPNTVDPAVLIAGVYLTGDPSANFSRALRAHTSCPLDGCGHCWIRTIRCRADFGELIFLRRHCEHD